VNTSSKATTSSEAPNDSDPSTDTDELTADPWSLPRTETMEIVTDMLSTPSGGDDNDPDHNFYQERWLRSLVNLVLFDVVSLQCSACLRQQSGRVISKEPNWLLSYQSYNFITWLSVSLVLGIISYISFSLLLKDLFTLKWKSLMNLVNVIFILVYVWGLPWNELIVPTGFGMGKALYVGFSLYHIKSASDMNGHVSE
jgi:hypothetical protein